MNETSPSNIIPAIVYSVAVIFIFIIVVVAIYNGLVKPKLHNGEITTFRRIYLNGNYYPYRYDDKFDINIYPELDDKVEGYLQTYYDEEVPYQVFMITKVIKEPYTVD